MKSQIYAATLIGAIGVVSNTFCVTYLSTYLVPIYEGGALPSTKEQSSRPTFQGNTSTHTSLNIDVSDSLMSTASQENEGSALISVESESSSHDARSAVSQTGSDNVSLRSTIDALFSETFTSSSTTVTFTPVAINSASNTVTSVSAAITLDTTTVTEATTTSNGAIVPAGRSIILQINLDNNNSGSSIVRRALGGFVSPADTDICTFASLFNLAQDQLFSNDFPIYYTSGGDYKELIGLVGVGETTIASDKSTSWAVSSGSDTSTTVPKTEDSTISPEASSSILTLSSYITQSESDLPITVSKTEESTVYPTTISGTLLPSSPLTPSESIGLQTSGTKAPPEFSSRISESSVWLGSTTANAPTLEASTSHTLATTGTGSALSTDSVSSGMTSQSSLDLSDLSVTSTVINEIGSTPTATNTINTGNTGANDTTSETSSSVDTASTDTVTTEVNTRADTTSKAEAETSTTNADTTTNESITTRSGTTDISSFDTTTSGEDTTTIESTTTQNTTTEPSSSDTTTTAEDTTTANGISTSTHETATTSQDATTSTADPTTPPRPNNDCDDLTPEYTIPNGDTFDIFCTNDVTQGTYSDSSFAWDFQECMDRCAHVGDDCRAITYERDINFDYAEKDFCC
ncbi:hypothetical protein FANTH_7975 [Fusarium anthophilum]|uniref:Apple domain-containing protein n=1 Tax=Fusarium anthophilum TaxID=48485 RepID=A0A8H5E260_9HYPO|nr:hypothetical protein FANTH_7975 [Fusarium anthophilum]